MTNALLDRTAVVYIVGSTSESTLETNGLQVGIDHIALARPISKWACKVHSVDQIGRIAAQAIRIATTAPRGPVLVDVPADVLGALAPSSTLSGSPLGAAPAALAVDAMLERVAGASRPVMLLGGAPSDTARVAFNDLLDVTGVPCFVDYGAIGVVGDDDDRYGGTLFQLGGCPRKPGLTSCSPSACASGSTRPACVTWHLVGNVSAAGRQRPRGARPVPPPRWHSSPIPAGDQALAARSRDHVWKVDPEWRASLRAALTATRSDLDAIDSVAGDRLHPYAAARVASDVAARHGGVIFGDGAVCKHWLHDALRLPAGSRYLTHSRLGCMGWAQGRRSVPRQRCRVGQWCASPATVPSGSPSVSSRRWCAMAFRSVSS